MDWNPRINRAVCWRPVGNRHRPTEGIKLKEREIKPNTLEALFSDVQHVLDYVQGVGNEEPRQQTGVQLDLAHLTPNGPHTPSQSPNGPLRTPTSPAISLNDDVLIMIFTLLADSPLESPAVFKSGTNSPGGPFLMMSRMRNSTRASQSASQQPQPGEESRGTLRRCALVSKAWYHAAVKLLWYTAVLRLENLEEELVKWSSKIYGVVEGDDQPETTMSGDAKEAVGLGCDTFTCSAPQRRWARRLVLLGGGMKSAPSSSSRIPLQDLWGMFPCVQNVEIFGYGWGTDGLLDLDADPRPALGIIRSPRKLLSLHRIRTLEITATSEHLLRGKVPGQNFLEVTRFLGDLRALRSLTLRCFTYRVSTETTTTHASSTVTHSSVALPSPSNRSLIVQGHREQDGIPSSPSYALRDLTLEKCSLSLVALHWLVGCHTHATLGVMTVTGCSFWDDDDANGVWDMDEEMVGKAAFEAMVDRLSVDLPVFSMSTS